MQYGRREMVIGIADWRKVDLHAPYIRMTKSDIVKRGFNLGVPFEKTWSCYKGGIKHCKKCGTCVERLLAFKEAGIADPTVYESTQDALEAGVG